MRLSKTSLTAAVLVLASSVALADIEIEITGEAGAQTGSSADGPWEDLDEGDKLKSCSYIRLPGSYSYVCWKRIDPGGCGNEGKVQTTLSNIKILHVGTEVLNPGPLQFGAMDLVLTPEAQQCDATIVETGNCVGTQHCGFNTAIAQAAPLDPTPPGEQSQFYGYTEFGANGLLSRFSNQFSWPALLGTMPLVGPNAGQLIPIGPGETITYFEDGSFEITAVQTYCTAKSSVVCGPALMSASGASSASSTAGFELSAQPARGLRSGLVIYGNTGQAAIPFLGGLLCVAPPVRRTTTVSSGGTAGQCNGRFALDMNAFAAGLAGGNPEPYLSIPGTNVYTQFWGRDSAATGGLLSNGLQYTVGI